MENQFLYSLPENLRNDLREPFGFLVDENDLIRLLSKEKYIVSIGDQVTYTILKNNIKPIFCIVDFIIKRREYPDDMKNLIQSFGDKVKHIENPSGCITKELWDTIEELYSQELEGLSIRIEVDGEEDLAALPAIIMAPRDVTIIYGLPDKGVVIAKSNDENKNKVRKIIDKM